jgi:2-polyprenyl-6-hydroxyphenyl methylase/3-demethylubiquinone-9 3-methyltransferase
MAAPTTTHDLLALEAHAFDRQIDTRIANGHIPDLRLAPDCDWFYNSTWRRSAYVQLDFVEQFELIRDAIIAHAPKGRAARVLEVGSGPGYLSLELARAGFDVTGLDLSPRCVEVAEDTAARDPWKDSRGPIRYIAGDFFSDAALEPGSFDAVVFLGALHHFPAQDDVLSRARTLLVPGGLCIAHEPVRDRVTRGNAAFVHLMRVVLSTARAFYTTYPIPEDDATMHREIASLHRELRYEGEGGEKLQSVNDNEAGYAEMHPALQSHFEELDFQWRYAFFHEFIGGLRFDETTNVALARYLRSMDRELCQLGVLSATEFFFVGRKPV